MKVFLVSMILLIATLIGIGVNFIYINNVAKDLSAMLDSLPTVDHTDCALAAAGIVSYWEERADYVALSVSYTITDRVSEQAVTLAACAACGDRFGYQTALALLRDAVGDMRRLEQLTIGNLL